MIRIGGNRFRQMTNLPGCFNVGEADYQYHGANRLGANALMACIFSGLVAGQEVPRYLEAAASSYADTPAAVFQHAISLEEELKREILARDGPENIYYLYDELSDVMVRHVTVKRDNKDLALALIKLKELRERYRNISLSDRSQFANQTYTFANQFGPMVELAMVITKGALLRDEFRGAHYKPEFPKRDDENWLKTTIALYKAEEPEISYEPVDIRHLKPIHRDYSQAKKVKPTLENIPANIVLPV